MTMEITGVTFDGGVTVSAPSVAGVLYSWGYNGLGGQLGLGDLTDRYIPTQVTAGAGAWKQVASGRDTSSLFSGAIATNGSLWTWGRNTNGALGQNNNQNCSVPVQVGTLTNWSKLSLGNFNGLAIKTDGTLWAWGWNGNGALGINNSEAYLSSPVQVGTDTNWAQVDTTNGRATFAVRTDGTLWAWGQNIFGGLGLGNTITRSSPTQVGALNNWSQVAGITNEGGFAVKTDGTLWAWGANNQGQLGINAVTGTISSPVQVGSDTNWAWVATRSHSTATTAAIKTNGTLWTWGPASAMLGQGSPAVTRSSPVQVGAGTTWARVVCGGSFMLATKTDGTLWAWGTNTYGQLGTGGGDSFSPVQVGALTWWSTSAGYMAAGSRESFAASKVAGAQNLPIELNDVTGTPPPAPPATWYAGNSMNTARQALAGAGTQSAGLAIGGSTSGGVALTDTEEYNGSIWATRNTLPITVRYLAGTGTQTAALAIGGLPSPNDSKTQEYDGSSWTSGGDLNTARSQLAAAGTQTSALAIGGNASGYSAATEEYDGTSWTTGGNLGTSRYLLAGAGTQTAGLAFGGRISSGSNTTATEEYDGIAWSAGGSLNTSRRCLAGAGLQTSSLAFGGYNGSNPVNAAEEYNGSAWSSIDNLGTARRYLGGAAGLAFAGNTGNLNITAATEEYR